MTIVTEGCTESHLCLELPEKVLQTVSQLQIYSNRVLRVTRKRLTHILFVHVSLVQRCREVFCKDLRKQGVLQSAKNK